ncbi:amidohydrolase [Xylariomycetidae sp. FL0641]|nr:amidohydrolase [Xylariomycetidae sp. FL0641]
MRITNVIIPSRESQDRQRWDVNVEGGRVQHIQPSTSKTHEAPPGLLLPALCHPHIHLDKPYILTCNHEPSASSASSGHPDYADLAPRTGTFAEALANTSKAKERYTDEDLYLRGSQLLADSYAYAVTSLRAFVELDHLTGTLPLTVGIRLKHDFAHLLEVQLCAFAQDPIFSTEHGERNRAIITTALREHGLEIGALGTTPYVETCPDAAVQNIEWAINTALEYGLHLDFHLDYNLTPPADGTAPPLTFTVLELLQKHNWTRNADPSKTIALGHCTQLSLLSNRERQRLADTIRDSGLPVHFVGLPTSDLFMMGRPGDDTEAGHNRPRGTLQVPALIRDHGLRACAGVNNMGNAFTPLGTGDPLQLAEWGVGIYQAGTPEDAELLYGCVSWRAREAIGLSSNQIGAALEEGQQLKDVLVVGNRKAVELPGKRNGEVLRVTARQRVGFKDIVWDPPTPELRTVIR